MNRMNNRTPRLATLALMLAALTACTKTNITPNDDLTNALNPSSGAPIAFETKDAFSKAVIEDIDDLQQDGNKFLVWSWFQGTTSGPMFTAKGTEVKYGQTTGWTYEQTRYWLNGTYDFAAVYPATVSGTYEPSTPGATPILTVNNFDVTTQDDLLVAFNNGPDGNGIDGSQGNANNPVNLNFKHALARVKFKVKLAEEDFFTEVADETTGDVHTEQIGFGYATIAGINGIYKTGSLSGTSNNELVWSLSAVDNLVVEYPSDSPIILDSQNTNILGEDGLLVLPQSFENNNDAKLFCNLGLIFPNIADRVITSDIEVQLNTLKVKSWEANKVYVYEGVVTQDFKIEFNIVSITDWVDDTLGGLIIN